MLKSTSNRERSAMGSSIVICEVLNLAGQFPEVGVCKQQARVTSNVASEIPRIGDIVTLTKKSSIALKKVSIQGTK